MNLSSLLFGNQYKHFVTNLSVEDYPFLPEIDDVIEIIKNEYNLPKLCDIVLVDHGYSAVASFCINVYYIRKFPNRIGFRNLINSDDTNPLVILNLFNIKKHFMNHSLEDSVYFCLAHELKHYKDYIENKFKFTKTPGKMCWSDTGKDHKTYNPISIELYYYDPSVYCVLYNSTPWEVSANSSAYKILHDHLGKHFYIAGTVPKLFNDDVRELYIKNSEVIHLCY